MFCLWAELFLQFATLEHFLFGESDSFLAEFPNLFGLVLVCDSIGLLIFKNLATRSTGTLGLAVFAPPSNGLGATVPTPVDIGLVTIWIINDLSQSLPGFFHAHVSTRDILHEPRKGLAEPGALFSEKSCFGNASGVHRRESDAGGVVITAVQFRYGHHVANLGVLVGLGAEKRLSVCHFNGLLHPLFQSLQVSKIGLRIDQPPSNSVCVSSNGSNNANTSPFGARHVVQQQVNQKEVAQVINTHAHFKTVVSPGRFRVGRSVDGGVTNQVRQRTRRFEGLEVGDKIANTLQAAQFKFHGCVRALGEVHFLCDRVHLVDITDGQDHKVSTSIQKGLGAPETKSRGCPSHNNELSEANLESAQNLGCLLVFWEVQFLGKFCVGFRKSTKFRQGLFGAEQGRRHGSRLLLSAGNRCRLVERRRRKGVNRRQGRKKSHNSKHPRFLPTFAMGGVN
mmetsp:Transcript_23095/g.53032  ORF Transcript_23095/g.53032 Transcript_23095/m.53032 type:complete len:452 (-) Transcript_23095:97-1452(-)